MHFGEHVAQIIAWTGGYREVPYMTSVGHYLVQLLGTTFYPDAQMARQHIMGNEILHLIGNTIYAVGAIGLLFFLRTKATITAAVIESFHLYEHLCLTVSAAIVGIPSGMSTLWGLPLEPTTLVALRVWWHFGMNALPTLLSVVAIYAVYTIARSK